MTPEDLNVSCCFCGQGLLYKDAAEVSVCLTSNIEEVQGLYAHTSCFDKALHESVPRLLDNLTNAE
ncbi:hypothetical protein [Mucilaginibacter arboris]|uniref:Uncharacterized protein n=1 Tax=Mucilaginibacter arboris TaxID=2682090 RepID=A0A7K1T1S2_9SPHI|nr:hypothetical protein [Mucilaginibacter arboris]MVN23504.1 hypothetical protein [Mucilaginibacter arboris]